MATFRTPERQARHASLIHTWKTTRSPQALEELMADYQPLFRAQIAGTLRGRTLAPDHEADLLQECAFALVRAVEGYDPNKCPSIAPYLTRYVQGAMRRYVLDFRAACRLGTNSDDRKAYYAAQRLRIQRLNQGREESLDGEIRTVANDTATSIKTAKRAVLAINASSVGIEDVDLVAVQDPSPLDTQAQARAMAAFEHHAQSLPERTRTIVCETLLGHRVDGAVARMAERYDLTPRRVRQIQAEGLAALRRLLEADNITADAVF